MSRFSLYAALPPPASAPRIANAIIRTDKHDREFLDVVGVISHRLTSAEERENNQHVGSVLEGLEAVEDGERDIGEAEDDRCGHGVDP